MKLVTVTCKCGAVFVVACSRQPPRRCPTCVRNDLAAKKRAWYDEHRRTTPPKKPGQRVVIEAQTMHDALASVRAGNDDWDWVPRGLPRPVKCPPGSPEKVEALRRRLELGVELWSEEDLRP